MAFFIFLNKKLHFLLKKVHYLTIDLSVITKKLGGKIMNQNKVVEYTGMNDYIFKEIFQRKKFLVAYLAIVGIQAKEEDIVYENTELKGEVRLKAVRFDIRIKNLKTRIDLEAQKAKIAGRNQEGKWVSYEEYQNRRKIHYASMLHSEAYQEGEKYFEGPKTKVIFFLD